MDELIRYQMRSLSSGSRKTRIETEERMKLFGRNKSLSSGSRKTRIETIGGETMRVIGNV